LTAEPFIAPLNTTSVTAMRQFGFNDTVYKACLSGAAGDYSAWRTTPLDYPFNTYRDSDSNSLVEDPNFTTSVMQSFRAALGLRAVVSNHGLQPTLTAAAMPVYAEISSVRSDRGLGFHDRNRTAVPSDGNRDLANDRGRRQREYLAAAIAELRERPQVAPKE
jgi:hypothetical protein